MYRVGKKSVIFSRCTWNSAVGKVISTYLINIFSPQERSGMTEVQCSAIIELLFEMNNSYPGS